MAAERQTIRIFASIAVVIEISIVNFERIKRDRSARFGTSETEVQDEAHEPHPYIKEM
jgi:hypothetical protein